MKLYIVRHGQAELLNAGENADLQDRQRALTAEGWREAHAAGQHLKQALAGATPKIIVSPYRRAQETAQEIASVLDYDSEHLITLEPITPKHTPQEAMLALRAYENEASLVLISHQPLVSQLISYLVWHKDEPSIAMGTAYVACLDLDVLASDTAQLLWVKSPRSF